MSCPSFMCVGPPAEQKSGTRLAPLIAGVGSTVYLSGRSRLFTVFSGESERVLERNKPLIRSSAWSGPAHPRQSGPGTTPRLDGGSAGRAGQRRC
jgi:hypothetical protein